MYHNFGNIFLSDDEVLKHSRDTAPFDVVEIPFDGSDDECLSMLQVYSQ